MVRTMWPERCAGQLEELGAGGRAGRRGWGKGGGSAPRAGPGPRTASPLRLPGHACFRFPARENRGRERGPKESVSAWQRLAEGEQSQLSPTVPQKPCPSPLLGPFYFPEGRGGSRGLPICWTPLIQVQSFQLRLFWDSVIL